MTSPFLLYGLSTFFKMFLNTIEDAGNNVSALTLHAFTQHS